MRCMIGASKGWSEQLVASCSVHIGQKAPSRTLGTTTTHGTGAPWGQHDAKFAEQATQRIGLHYSHLHKLLPHAVQGQAGLVLFALDGHFLNMRLLGRDPNGLCVESVSLVAQRERPHVLCRQQLDLVAHSKQSTCTVVSTTAGFYCHQRRLPICKKIQSPLDVSISGAESLQSRHPRCEVETHS